MEVVLLLIGLGVGFAVGFLLAKSKSGRQEVDNQSIEKLQEQQLINAKLEQSESHLVKERNQLKTELEEVRSKFNESEKSLASSRQHFKDQEERQAGQKKEFEDLNKRFNTEFQNLANKILEEKSEKFTEKNKDNIESILKPLRERIKDFEEKVERNYGEEKKEKAELKGEIKQLMELNHKISQEANNLASALKGDQKMQGNWGEMILERILESSGLVKGEEYKTQDSTYNEQGDRIQPDVVIYLPDDKHLIIDSKVSMIAYERYTNSETDEDKEHHLKAHITSVKGHVKDLQDKNYQKGIGFNSPDYVLMFMPIESSFSLSIQADTELFHYAQSKKIVIVSPSTLLATLFTVSSVWKQERRSKNAEAIAVKSAALYDKFVGFAEDMIKIGDRLDSTKKVYGEAMNKLNQGSGNLVRRTEELRKMGIQPKKELPKQLTEEQEIDE
ncbi:MAG: DNA recombination protein RmuC [Flavobacteriales bacterium]|jgi:DNA recombination protein RmuC